MRILIAANGSMPTEDILNFSKQFIQNASESTTILKVLDPGKDRPPVGCKFLEEQAREVLGTDKLNVCIRIGQTAEEIIHETQTGSYDLVIVGDRRSGWLAQKFTRSAAKRIAERAACSVMILRGDVGAIQNVLFCDSGAKNSPLLQKFNTQFANLLDGKEDVTVLHIMSQISAGPGIRGQQLRSAADELIKAHTPEGDLLDRDVQTFTQLGIHSKPKVRHGLVVDEIISEARSGHYDLVVIGACVSKGWERLLLDDLSHKILTHIDRPVLVVR